MLEAFMTSDTVRRSAAGAIDVPADVVALRAFAWRDDSGRRYAVLVDPADHRVATLRVAEAAFLRLCERLAYERRREPEEAILAAFADAQEVVREANTLTGGVRRADLALVGATICVATEGRMVIGLMGPGQTLTLQDGEIYAIPPLSQAAPDVGPEIAVVDTPPLGAAEFRPALFETDTGSGDRVLLCSLPLARLLAEAAAEHPALFQTGLATLLRGDRQLLAARLHEIMDGQEGALALVVAPADPMGPEEVGAPLVVASGRTLASTTPPPDPAAAEIGGWPDDDLWVTPRGPSADRETRSPIWATAASPAPVVMAVDRYRRDSAGGASARWSWLPRLPFGKIAAVGALVLVTTVFGYVGVTQWSERVAQQQAVVQTSLAEADRLLADLGAEGSAEDLMRQIGLVEERLAAARANGASDAEIAMREDQLRVARDLLQGVGRLENVTTVGVLPAGVAGAANPRLVKVGETVFVVADAVYALDATDGLLVELLRPGDVVGDVVVEPILVAAEEGGALVVSDGRRLFRYEGGAEWSATQLGLLEGTRPWVTSLGGGFQGAWYIVIGANGRVMKFDAERLGSLPADWTQGIAGSDVLLPVDMAIDGRIYLVSDDGAFTVFYRGEEEAFEGSRPTFSDPTAVEATIDTVYIWVTDNTPQGPTVVRLDRGSYARLDYQLPYDVDAAPLGRLLDATVLERSGEVYLLFDGVILRATFP